MLKSKWFWIVILGLALVAWWKFGGAPQNDSKFKAFSIPVPESNWAAMANGKVDVDGGIIEVAARSGGTYREIFVEEGDVVEAGQVLAVQEDDEERISLRASEASLEAARAQLARLQVRHDIAQRELERLVPLVDIDAASTLELDQANDELRRIDVDIRAQKASLLQSEAQLESVKFRLEQRKVRAPVAGRIIEAKARPGVGASTLQVSTAFTLMPNAQKIVRADLDEGFVKSVYIGQKAVISPDANPEETYEGEVLRKGEIFGRRTTQASQGAAGGSDHVIEVVVGAGEIPLLIGQRVKVRFLKEGQDVPEAPAPRGTMTPETSTVDKGDES